jgi:hypothetical protein
MSDPKEVIKAMRRGSREGQAILRRRGGPHSKKGYQRPRQKDWNHG